MKKGFIFFIALSLTLALAGYYAYIQKLDYDVLVSIDKNNFIVADPNIKFEGIEEKNNKLQITLKGKIFNHSMKVSTVSKDKVNRKTIDGITASIISSGKNADLGWIVSNYNENEREFIKEIFKDPEILNGYKSILNSFKEYYIYGYINYKKFKIIILDRVLEDGSVMKFPIICIKNEDKTYSQTEKLKADLFLFYLNAVLRSGHINKAV